jgi:phage-related protein
VTDVSLKFLLFGEDRSAGKTLHGVAGEAEKTGSNLKRNVAAGAAAAGVALAAFGKISVDKFKEVGSETMGLMRIMGGTAEESSRLRFAAQQSGVTYETLSKSTGKFEKALGAATASGKSNAAMVKTLGFNFRDASGHILPMTALLPKLADKFEHMPGGAEKTALAMKLFGKSGADMLPFLNKGSAGIASLEHESDKFGNTLTGKNLAALKASKASQREWNASLDGLKIQIGAQILPIMNTLVGFIRGKVIPVIIAISGFMQKHSSILKLVGVVLGTLIVGIKAWTIAQKILNTVLAMNPIGMVVVAIAALAVGLIYAYNHSKTFRDIVQAAFHAVGVAIDWVKQHWQLLISLIGGPFVAVIVLIVSHWNTLKRVAMDAIRAIVMAFLDMVGTVVHGAASMFGWVPGVGGKLRSAARAFDAFRDGVNRSLGGVQKNVTVSAHVSGAQEVINGLSNVANLINYIKNNGHVDIGVSGRGTAGLASGGTMYDGLTTVGEQGPELMMKSGPSVKVLSNAQSRHFLSSAGSRGGGGTTEIHLHIDHPLASAADIAGAVVPALATHVRNGGIRPW